MNDVAIRPLVAADLPAIVALFCAVFNGPPWNEGWTHDAAARRLGDYLATPNCLGRVVADADATIAFALGHFETYADQRHFHLKEMCVRPDRQRRGVGRRLLEDLTAEARAAGAARAYLLTAREQRAAEFYASCGFYVSPRMVLMARRFEDR